MKYQLTYFLILFFFTVKSQEMTLKIQQIDDIKMNMNAYNQCYRESIETCSSDPIEKIKNYLEGFNNRDYLLEIGESNLYNYPNKDITLFYVENKQFHTFSDIHSEPLDYLLSKRILVGLNKKNNSLVFISGDIFKNYIATDFNLDERKPETFYPFLELKLYNFWIKNIQFIEYKGDFLYFKAYSNTVKEHILIKEYRYRFDNLQVKTINFNWTEQGSYKWTND